LTNEHTLYAPPKKSVTTLLRENPYVLGLACVSSFNSLLLLSANND
jgi:hypothetical protein